ARGVVVAATEQPGLAPERDGLDGALSPVVREHEAPIVEEARQRLPLVVGILEGGPRVATLALEEGALLLDPVEEQIDVGAQELRPQTLDLGGRFVLPRGVELEDTSNAHEPLSRDGALRCRSLPEAPPAMIPTADLGAL